MKEKLIEIIKKRKIVVYICCIFITFFVAFIVFLMVNKNKLYSAENRVIEGKNINGDSIYKEVTYNDKTYKYNTDIINILILGIDSNLPVTKNNPVGLMGQSDALYLVSIDTKREDTKIYAIPRDSMTIVEEYDSTGTLVNIENEQITLQYAFGDSCEKSSELSSKAVSLLMYGVPINRVCVFNYDAIAIINDYAGGIEVTFEKDFTDDNGTSSQPDFVKGNTVTLDNEQAGVYLQKRDITVMNSALDRLSRQEQYIAGLADTMKSKVKKNPMIISDIAKSLKKNDSIYTDMTAYEMTYLSYKAIKSGLSKDKIITLPGNNEMGEVYVEYKVDNSELRDIIINNFYKEKK